MSRKNSTIERMKADRERLLAEMAEHRAMMERIEPQLAMLNRYLGLIPMLTSTTSDTTPTKRKYTRKKKAQTDENILIPTHRCFDCGTTVTVDVDPKLGPKCHECGGLQVEKIQE